LSEHYLKGSPGVLESEKNALRQELYWKRDRYIPALEGADVYLTIDQNVQHIVEKALDDVMREHRARGAWAVVQQVKTGAILAMASRPAFDPNQFVTTEENVRLNRAIGFVYEPGSTMKAAVIAAALNEKVVNPSTVVDCEDGQWWYANRPLRDHHGHDRLSVADVLKKSSNIGTAKIALMLGKTRLERYLRSFGLGHSLGIDLPGEESGILHASDNWTKISPTRIAIGQGVAVTAVQMLNMFCAIANDGYLMKPYVTRQVRDSSGSVLLTRRPEVLGRPISSETAKTMRELLGRVTQDGGTGRRARVKGYAVAGKTGTAQKPENGAYSSTAYVASFVGFLPAEDPQIGVIVVVDEPQPIHYGGVVAGPAFSRIAGQTIRCLDIAPYRYELASDSR